MKKFYPFKLQIVLLLFSSFIFLQVSESKAQTPGNYSFGDYTAGTEMVIGTSAGSFSWDIPVNYNNPTLSGLTAVVVGTGYDAINKIRVIVNSGPTTNYLAFNRNGGTASVTKGIIRSTNGNAFKLNSIDLIPVNTAAHNLSIRAMKNGLQVGSVVTRSFPAASPIVFQSIDLTSNPDFADIDAFEVFSDVADLGVRVNNINISSVSAAAPTLTTTTPTGVTTSAALLGGNITNSGGGTVSERGIVYSASNSDPVIDGTGVTKVPIGSGIGIFSDLLSVLSAGTTYYVKAYAISGSLTGYGGVETFTTKINLTSVNRQSAALNNSSVVYYDAVFPASITGLSSSNFSISTPDLLGVSIANVTGSGTNWTVGVNTGNANQSGTLRLDLINTTGVSPQIANIPFTGQVYTIDKIAPSVTLSSTAGASGSTIDANSIVITAQFSESVGSTFDINDIVPINASITEFTAESSPANSYTFKVTPSAPGLVTVTVPASSVQDDAGNNNTSGTFSFTYTPLNQPPVVTTSSGNTVYSGNAVTVDAGITVSDFDNSTLVSAQVSITSGFVNGEDVLNFVNQNGITGIYNHATGILTLTGSATLANYQAALRSIMYGNNILTPTTGNRTITFELNDGTINGNTADKLLKVVVFPTITTSTPINVTNTGATLGGNITSAGGGTITARGIVFSTINTNPKIGETHVTQVSLGVGEGAFSNDFSLLTAGTVYYVNTYATNEAGTTYGTVVTFATIPNNPTITSNSPVCSGSAINLSTPEVTGASYQWSGPNSFNSIDRNPSIPNAAAEHAGNYSLTITLNGVTSSASTTNVVVNSRPATPSASNNGPVHTGDAINLFATSVAGATYNWTGPNSFCSTEQNPTIANASVANSGDYFVTITVAGCTSTAAQTNVVVENPPTINVTPVGTAVSLSANYGTASTSNTYTVSGINLTSVILVEVPGGFEVSDDNINYSTTVNIPQSGGLIYVRLNGTSSVNTYTGNITLSSDAVTSTIALPSSNIIRAPLTVTANNVNKTYGETLTDGSSVAFTASGLENGETIGSVTVAYGAGSSSTSGVNTYTGSVTADAATGGTFTASNYTITYTAGDIVVGAKTLAVTVTGVDKIYDGNTDATVTISDNRVLGDDLNVIYTKALFTTATAGNSKIVNVTGFSISGPSSDNYILSATNISTTAAITPRMITVAATPKSKIYGDADPIFTYTYTGSLIGNDSFSGKLIRVTGENVNSYSINKGTLTLGNNYSILYEGANLTISKAVLTVTVNNATICQRNNLPTFTLTYNGFKFADKENNLSTRPTVSTTANRNSPAGNYALIPGGAVSTNYSFVYVNGQLTINAIPVVAITSDIGLSVSLGATVKLTATGGISYVWSNANGIVTGQNANVLTVRPSQNTTYTVTATNASGCSETATITVTVEDNLQLIEGTNILTPNGDGKNDFLIIRNIDMYPNNEIKIFDIAGRLIYSKKKYDNSWAGTLNGSPLSKGTYYYIIDFGDRKGKKKGFVSIVRD